MINAQNSDEIYLLDYIFALSCALTFFAKQLFFHCVKYLLRHLLADIYFTTQSLVKLQPNKVALIVINGKGSHPVNPINYYFILLNF